MRMFNTLYVVILMPHMLMILISQIMLDLPGIYLILILMLHMLIALTFLLIGSSYCTLSSEYSKHKMLAVIISIAGPLGSN